MHVVVFAGAALGGAIGMVITAAALALGAPGWAAVMVPIPFVVFAGWVIGKLGQR